MIRYLLINLIIFISTGVCSSFELGKFYVFKDPYGRNLFSGQLSSDNSYLSAEVLYDGNESSGKREIVLFEFGDNPSPPDSGFAYRDRKNDISAENVYDGYMVDWSSFSDTEYDFTYFHYQSKGNNKGLQLKKSKYDYDEEDFPFTYYYIDKTDPLNLSDDLFPGNPLYIKKIFDYSSTIDYNKYLMGEDEDAYFITYLDKSDDSYIATSYSASRTILFDPNSATKTIGNPQGINVTRRGKDFDAVVTFNTNYEQDIYYFCDIIKNGGIEPKFLKSIGIFPRNKDYTLDEGRYAPIRKQMKPSFSHDGRYVAFLNQSLKLNEKIDLYIFDTTDLFHVYDQDVVNTNERSKRDEYCYDDFSNYKFDGSMIRSIDTDIVTFLGFKQSMETGKDYAWHPERDVIFYVKKYINEQGEANYQIKSYNLKNDENYIVMESPNRIGYLSISDDGGYLIFSFIALDQEFDNCIGCEDEDVYSRKIGVAELIEK